jgi:hypothetical protein
MTSSEIAQHAAVLDVDEMDLAAVQRELGAYRPSNQAEVIVRCALLRMPCLFPGSTSPAGGSRLLPCPSPSSS